MSQSILPIEYKVRLEPNLQTLTFIGSMSVIVDLQQQISSIALDSVELDIDSCRILFDGETGGKGRHCDFSVEPGVLAVHLPEPRAGKASLSVEFHGKLNLDLRGFYKAAYHYQGEERYLAVTQFEEIDARRAFPCFDHPRFNTPFDIELICDSGHRAIATTSIESETPLDGGRKIVGFHKTPPMPTYLLFFGVGDFEYVEDRSFHVPIGVYATPGKAGLGAEAVVFTRQALAYCEKFTGVDYPVDKLDLIAVPEFAYGAMENLGAISFRENLLLFYPELVSTTGIEGIASITAHECAHMWFGDLTSPLDWQYVWLNEAFATYVTGLILDDAHPEWRAADRFIRGAAGAAMTRDSLVNTIPIEFPDAGVTEIDSSTAPIVYSKAGLVLMMVHRWLGDEKFTAGVRNYLSRYAYQSVDTTGFLEAFGEGAGSLASEIIENWIHRPGFPLVRSRRTGPVLEIAQERFTHLAHEDGQIWQIPISLCLFDESGEVEIRNFLLAEQFMSIEIPASTKAWKLNAGRYGVYRCSTDEDNFRELGVLAREGLLGSRDMYGLISDLRALVIKGEKTLDCFIDYLLSYFSVSEDYLVVSEITSALVGFFRLVPEKATEIAFTGKKLLFPIYEKIGLVPLEGEPYLDTIMRDEIVWPLFLFGVDDIRSELIKRFALLTDDKSVETDLIPYVIKAGAYSSSGNLGWFKNRIENGDTPAEMKKYLYQGLGWFQDRETTAAILDYIMASIEPQNRIQVIREITSNSEFDPIL
ncbi:MAG: M1 family metallopeptidase, partial [Spirochaetales bacterium]|nr:M1 family metallopeptidase [Spirochaetales bacterium]